MKHIIHYPAVLALALWSGPVFAQPGYQKPPQEVLDVLNASLPPSPFFSPNMREVVFAQRVRYPAIADLAQPMLRLAGVRINPRTSALSSYRYYFTGLSLKRLPDGAETPIRLPADVRLGAPQWNATATMFAFSNEATNGIELWVGEAATGRVRRLAGVKINPLLGSSIQWMADQQTLLVKGIPPERGAPPAAPSAPPGPKVQETSGVAAASSSYETRDVLTSPHDADLFDYYATSQLVLVHAVSGKITPIGKPAVFGNVSAAPGGSRILVERIHRPYSYIRAYYRFPKEVEVWSTDGTLVETVASQPLADEVPIEGVVTGPRSHSWRPTEAATLIWAEALDGGNPRTQAPHRDRLMIKREGGTAKELCQLEHRFSGIDWIEQGGLALVSDYDRDRRWTRTFILDADDSSVTRRPLWDMSIDEKYRNPGYPVYRVLSTGAWVVRQEKGWIYLSGPGGSTEGNRPFLDRLDLRTLKTERLFRSDRMSLESFEDWMDPEAGTFVTRRESPTDPPNLILRTLGKDPVIGAPEGEATRVSTAQSITRFPDPTPQIRGISKRLVTYTRADGVPLSFMLYLPPGYKEGTRLPTVLWAYPGDYADKNVAGQVEGSSQEFTTLTGTSELFFLLQGYAVLDDTAMPVIGPPETVYDTFNEQLVMNAQAAIDKAVELGVTDRNRIGVGGHSHGALMAAALLAHSNLFRAGIARSGAYNKALVPFGFQNEKRTLYQARDTYIKVSPFFHADKFRDPLLLIHGELDANPGTVPLQSEKLYEAMRGIGKTVRLVMLPYENHGYAARETTEHVLFEMLSWFDRFVKKAGPRPGTAATPNPATFGHTQWQAAPSDAAKPAARLTVLVDNSVAEMGVKAVWGFACLVETRGHTVLFDTGADPAVLKDNLAALKVDPARIEAVVISHFHWDHTWGAPGLAVRKGLPAYTPGSFDRYAQEAAALDAAGLVRVTVTAGTNLFDGVGVSEPLRFGGTSPSTGEQREQCLMIDTSEGVVVIVGCSHPGILALLEQVRKQSRRPIHLVLGGFHLLGTSTAEVRTLATAMKAMGVDRVGATHCTSEAAASVFRDVFGERYVNAGVGAVIEVAAPPSGAH